MAIRKGSGLVVGERTGLSSGANDDIILTAVRRRGEMIRRIVNVYDQRDTQSGEKQAQKVNWQSVILQGGTVLAGDFTGQSYGWDPKCRAQLNATFWEGLIDKNGVEIGNDSRYPH